MNFKLSVLVLLVASSVIGWLPKYSEVLLAVAVILIGVIGVYVSFVMAARRYFYVAVFLIFHVVMTVLTGYIYLNRHNVVPAGFHFSVFREDNLQMALIVFGFSVIAIILPWLFFLRKDPSIFTVTVESAVTDLLGHIYFIKQSWLHGLLSVSMLLAILIFATNTSVFEVSYPFQGQTQWLRQEFMKIPTIMAAMGLAIAYAKFIFSKESGRILTLARLNALFVFGLMLLLIGSRGLFTFLAGFIGAFEIYLLVKRRGSFLWAMIFLFFSWFLYMSWPYMRWNLSLIPWNVAFTEALLIGIGRSADVQALAIQEAGLLINDFAMIGASLFHLLYVIDLVETGVTLAGSTFINLIPNILPGFLDGVLWTRPLNDNWLLADYYSHGGGFLLVANAYWNGGLWVATLFMATLASIFVGFDHYLRKSGMLYRIGYWLWLPVMLVQIGYGIQGEARVVELLVALLLIERLFGPKLSPQAADEV